MIQELYRTIEVNYIREASLYILFIRALQVDLLRGGSRRLPQS